LAALDRQLRFGNSRREALGLNALRAMLEAWHFSSGATFEFGSRSRDYGYLPKITADFHAWFAPVLKATEAYSISRESFAPHVRTALGKKFRGLWTKPGMYDDLERVCRSIRNVGFWREGWIGVKETLRFDGPAMAPDVRARLEGLEKLLRPVDLIQKVRSMILTRGGSRFEMEDVDDEKGAATVSRRREDVALALGQETAKDSAGFQELLPDLTSGDGLLWKFGVGLALGTDDPDGIWNVLTAQFKATEKKVRNSLVLSGFLEGMNTRDSAHVDRLLNEALTDDVLAANFPSLQRSVPIDSRGAARLMKALDTAPAWQFKVLAWGGVSVSIPGADFRTLLRGIAAKPDGFWVAAEILDMRLFADRDKPEGADPEVIATGRDLVEVLDFGELGRNQDHHVGSLIARCLKGPDGLAVTQDLCRRFMHAIVANEIHAYGYDEVIGRLFKVQPVVMLDGFFGGTTDEINTGQKIIEDLVDVNEGNPLDAVSRAEILAWCEQRRAERYRIMASVVTLFRPGGAGEGMAWSDIAQALLDGAPDRLAIVKEYARRFRPHTYSGSLAAAMELALPPLRCLEDDADPAVAAFAKTERTRLRQEIETSRQHETETDRRMDERFE
jgi:hypothetical protein